MHDNLLILGATGNIGTVLSGKLIEDGIPFRAGVPASQVRDLAAREIESVALDFNDPGSLKAAMNGITLLFMLLPADERMLTWSDAVLDAARAQGVRHIVRSSVIDAHPDSPYALFQVHGQIDEKVRNCGIAYTILHPNSFMQNYAVYYGPAITRENAFYLAQDDALISLVDVRDIAAAARQVLAAPDRHAGREYTLTGPEAISNYDVAHVLTSVLGREILYEPLNERQSLLRMKADDYSAWDMNVTISLDRHIRDGRSAPVSPDVGLLTGSAPVNFLTFAEDYADRWLPEPARR